MTDLDSTQIINADESLLQNSSTIDSEASLKVTNGTESNTYQIAKEAVIGRANPSDIIISASSLSKQHAKITYNNGQYFITDLGSSNKTFQNKVQLQPHVCYALHNGDEIKLGDVLCSWNEQKTMQKTNNTISEPISETYIPAANTLVEEDSPWNMEDELPVSDVDEAKADVIPSTQTINDSYDDQEPTQPVKIWNGNSSNSNHLSHTSIRNSDNFTLRKNGLNENSPNKSSAFISPSSIVTKDGEDDDDNLIIGSTILPATVPLAVESTQLSNDDQLEIVSSMQTKQIIETTTTITAEVEIDRIETNTIELTVDEKSSNNQLIETQKYDMDNEQIVTDIVETKREEVCQVIIDNETIIEQVTTTTTTTKATTTTTVTDNENPAGETLACDLQPIVEQTPSAMGVDKNEESSANTQTYDLEPVAEEMTSVTATITTTTTIVENENPYVQTLAYDLQPTNKLNEETSEDKIENVPIETQAYDLEPTTEEIKSTINNRNNDIPMDTQTYDLEPANEKTEGNEEPTAICVDTQAYSLDEEANASSPTPGSETLEVVPVSKLVDELQEAENSVDEATSGQQVEITINANVTKTPMQNERMETDQTDIRLTSLDNGIETKANSKTNDEIIGTEEKVTSNTNHDSIVDDEKQKIVEETKSIVIEQQEITDSNKASSIAIVHQPEEKISEAAPVELSCDTEESTLHIEENQNEEVNGDTEETEEAENSNADSRRVQRGVPRRTARRARGRRGGATRARVVSTRIHTGRRNAIVPATTDKEENNTTLEETINTETEESPTKSSIKTPDVEQKPTETSSHIQANAAPNIRVSARIKARASSGRNRQFPYTDDYVDLDDLEKQSKASNAAAAATTATPTAAAAPTGRRSTRGGRSSSSPQKRISLRQQPIDASESPDEKSKKQKGNADVYDQMETGGENEEPTLLTRTIGRKRKSTTPATTAQTKRTRPVTPPAPAPAPSSITTRRKQNSLTNQPTETSTVTPKRGRKSNKATTPAEQTSGKQSTNNDENRPVRIALSSHLNFDQTCLDKLRKLGFEIMDESCQVDALVVDRIRRTKKFFMCLARGAHILAPTWIEAMMKENRYIPYDKHYLVDSNAETRYGFHLRESVRLAKERPIFENYKIFCTKDTSPPYDDLKDIIEAAGGKFIDKINTTKPGKDLICIVAQLHKNEYEDLFKKGVPIVSEEFALSGISKQKLDFDMFSLFQTGTSVKTTGSKS